MFRSLDQSWCAFGDRSVVGHVVALGLTARTLLRVDHGPHWFFVFSWWWRVFKECVTLEEEARAGRLLYMSSESQLAIFCDARATRRNCLKKTAAARSATDLEVHGGRVCGGKVCCIGATFASFTVAYFYGPVVSKCP